MIDERAAGYEGAERAAAHADRCAVAMGSELWRKVAWVRFLEFMLASQPRFTTPCFRKWATDRLPSPPDTRAFGNITKRAAEEGLIRDTGQRVRLGSHGREVVLWERVAK